MNVLIFDDSGHLRAALDLEYQGDPERSESCFGEEERRDVLKAILRCAQVEEER